MAEDRDASTAAPTFNLDRPAPSASYRVLARKYRPSSFDDLIGQAAMVKTLSNAFELGRIHQAYMLTGVRGVGKTTTARILARAFNYELPAAWRPAGGHAADDPYAGARRALPGDHRIAPCRRDRNGCGVPYRHRRCARDHRQHSLSAGSRPHESLYHRRSAYAFETGFQRPVEDARRAAGACEIRLRDDRDRESPGYRALALPEIRSAPHRSRGARRASFLDLRQGRRSR